MLHGVRVPDWLVMKAARDIDPKLLTSKEVESVDVRREFVRKVGVERCLDVLQWKPLDAQGDYVLGEITIADNMKRRYLKMLNPSVGVWHIEAVHPECQTVQESLNYRAYGDKSKQWQPTSLS